MTRPPIPTNERERLQALVGLGLLDTAPEDRFDRITRAAAALLHAPISSITLIDEHREWHKSCIGVTRPEYPRAASVCGHAVLSDGPFLIPDTHRDPRFHDNPLVTGPPFIRAYAGVPLFSSDRHRVGVLCVKDVVPRAFSEDEVRRLQDLARWAESEINALHLQRMLEERRTFKNHLDVLFESSTELLAVADSDRRLLRTNPAFRRTVGLTQDELANRPYVDLIHPDDRTNAASVAADLAEGEGGSVEFRVRSDTGDYRTICWAVTQRDGLLYAIGSDVTAERAQRARDAARARELEIAHARFLRLADEAPLGIYETDANGRCTYTNRHYRELCGQRESALLDDGWIEAVHPDDRPRVATAWKRLVADGVEGRLEYRLVGSDNRVVAVESRAAAVRDGVGDVVGFVGCLVDVTARQRVREELERAATLAEESDRAKSQFLASISHELRTPMNAIIGLADLLAESELNRDQRENVETIRRSGGSMLTVVSDLLDFGRLEAGTLRLQSVPIDLRALADDAVDQFAPQLAGRPVDLINGYDADVPPVVIGDPGRLRQVMANLVGNAVRSTERGHVELSVRALGIADGKARIGLRVTDTGCGISPREQAWLSEIFSRTDSALKQGSGGLGLGLAIARQLVEMMGGTIGFESTAGKGSTFWAEIVLPVGDPIANQLPTHRFDRARAQPTPDQAGGAKAPPPAEPAKPSQRPPVVLVVDDSRVNLLVARKLLANIGCEVQTADGGVSAVAMAGSGQFDIIFMDCQMPGVDGFEATRRLRAAGNNTTIVALTANASAADREACLAVGMTDFLSKPVNLEQMRSMVARWATAPVSGVR